jgi:hypothetical protein
MWIEVSNLKFLKVAVTAAVTLAVFPCYVQLKKKPQHLQIIISLQKKSTERQIEEQNRAPFIRQSPLRMHISADKRWTHTNSEVGAFKVHS